MFGEPPRTEYDVQFRIFGIPVRIHPFFWILAVLLGLRNSTAQELLIWVGVVLVSILVHELGHAVAIRYFGWTPRIVLYSFGGLAIYDANFAPWQSGRRPKKTGATQILISLAGPAAGFALASIVVGLLYATRHEILFPWFGGVRTLGSGTTLGPTAMGNLVFDLLQVNIYWGILNLMPIYPLDGGQVARELFIANSNDGARQALQLSIATAIVLAVLGLMSGRTYLAVMFGYMAYMNYQQLNGPFRGFGGGAW